MTIHIGITLSLTATTGLAAASALPSHAARGARRACVGGVDRAGPKAAPGHDKLTVSMGL
jgi:hypothetical protein